MKKTSGTLKNLSGKRLRIAVVISRFNEEITKRLLEGAERTLAERGLLQKDISAIWVPGTFEVPVVLQKLARQKKFDALIALGAVIRGETPHFEYVAGEAARGVMQVSLQERIPIAFGILTTNTVRQALERAGGRCGNKGEEAALVAIEMATLFMEGKREHGTS